RRLGELGAIGRDQRPYAVAHARPGSRLRQPARQLPGLSGVAFEHQLALAREPRIQRVGADVGIAVHVAANPGAEAQHAPAPGRYLDVVLAAHGLLESVVERRYYA